MNKEQKRQQTDERWRLRFNEAGLSGYFEFLGRGYGRSQRKLSFVKCKSCNFEFSTYGVDAVLRKQARTICCPQCGIKSDGTVCWAKSQACNDAMDFYAQGHSLSETAKKFGVKEHQITNIAMQRNISNGRDFHIAGAEANAAAHRISEEKKKAIKEAKSAERKRQLLLRQKQRQKEKAEQKLIRQKEIEERKAKQEAERIAKNPLGLSYYQLSIQEKYDAVHICEVCGKQYTLRERMQVGDTKYCRDSGCCSNECTKKRARLKLRASGFPKNHLRRAHKYGCAYESGITLKKLIKRDGLRCAICGEMCNPNDHEWTKHFGPTSPTIDHIIPMAKGGGHIWDNVQVAHAICNSTKGAQYE